METVQAFNPNGESITIEMNYSGHTEQCGSFVGHPSEPCKRCGFSYYSHTG
jgi:hypothetical protein